MSALERALGTALGAKVVRLSAIAGGDINDAARAELADGRTVFVKSNARAPAGMFAAEARGLEWLAEARRAVAPAFVELLVTGGARRGPERQRSGTRICQGTPLRRWLQAFGAGVGLA